MRPQIKFEYLEQGMGANVAEGETETIEQFAQRIEKRCNELGDQENAAAPPIVMTTASPKGRLIASLQSMYFEETPNPFSQTEESAETTELPDNVDTTAN